ncbi:MAG: hypothetical protein B7X06_00745 [Verrucomicrobia bacterium 21-51-4]|nr:MAG: hypothetical protein B7X06_00745 [Verrucomicrobia bacterium 21-51-4]HQU08401.1 hypothetical protein [Opitutales bacterium]
MTLPDPENKPQVTLDALLKLKRLEQPDPRFWDSFSRDIKTKKLQLLLEKSRPSPWISVLKPLLFSGPVMATLLVVGLFLKTNTPHFMADYGNKPATAQIAMKPSGSHPDAAAPWAYAQLQTAQYVWDTIAEPTDLSISDALSFTPQDDYAMHVLESPLVAQCQTHYGAI